MRDRTRALRQWNVMKHAVAKSQVEFARRLMFGQRQESGALRRNIFPRDLQRFCGNIHAQHGLDAGQLQ